MDLKHKQMFLQYFDIMIECFPQLKSKNKVDRIYFFLKDIPEIGIKQICQTILDNFRQTPIPNDFHEAAQAWRRRNNFSKPQETIEPIAVDCNFCNDTGIVLAKHINDDKYNIMRCDCNSGLMNQKKMPPWDNGLLQAFKKTKCPIEWFKPDVNENDSDKKIYKSIYEKLVIYQEKIKKAEKYWSDLGYKGETK